MDDDTDDRRRRQWQDGTSVGRIQAVVDTATARADEAWRKYIAHISEECTSTCRTAGVNCADAVKLKRKWNAAKRAAQ